MSLKNEVCGIRYAIQLKELGFKQESPFQWVEAAWEYEIDTSLNKRVKSTKIELVFGAYTKIPDKINECAAYTLNHLGTWLPGLVDDRKSGRYQDLCFLMESKTNDSWLIKYETMDGNRLLACFEDEFQANARAKMLVFLKEKDLLPIDLV